MKIGFIFPGQGSQFIGMGKSLFDSYADAKYTFDIASEVLKMDMKDLLFKDNDNINQTKYTQPAILLVSYISYSLFTKFSNIPPVLSLGHSLGEISANVASNSIKIDKSFELVYKRGELMQKACSNIDAGMAVVIGLNDEKLEDFISKNDDLWYVNYNNDIQGVIAGSKPKLKMIENQLKNIGAKKYIILPISIASHCPILNVITNEFKDFLQTNMTNNFNFKIISNATTEAYNTKDKAIDLLTMQLVNPVLYKQSIIKYQNDVDCFIEFGGNVLKGLNKHITNKPTYSIFDVNSLESTLKQVSIQ